MKSLKMNLTVQIITKNNASTIVECLNSVAGLPVLVGDIGSTDGTLELIQGQGVAVERMPMIADEARNYLSQRCTTDYQLWLKPQEVFQGEIGQLTEPSYLVTVVNGGLVSKEVRLWHKKTQATFRGSIFEYLDFSATAIHPMVLFTKGQSLSLQGIQEWKDREPLNPDPYYYEACLLFGQREYDKFINASEHYMSLQTKPTMSAIMNRYHYAIVQIIHKKKVRPALQSLNICMCARPLMAEFWCLTGDVHYHLLNRFVDAKAFYKNAMILGRYRAADQWPIDVAKYRAYPEKMVRSCNDLIRTR